ncbi:sensor histidine kinase [Terribacillus sp. 179-K 1B1 HS]|uniref:histidine kinase n=1 Tax=Terribacillus sp. 179-K 1B1 HS TaxID=3142388 RepID=UPI0039A2ECAB
MQNSPNFPEATKRENTNMIAARMPGLIWIFVSYLVSVLLQINSNVSILHYIFFTILVFLFSVIYSRSHIFLPKRAWMYFVVQGMIVYGCTFFMYDQYVSIVLLFPLLLGQVIGMVGQKRWIFFSLLLGLFFLATLINVPSDILLLFLGVSLPVVLIIVGYAANFFKLVDAKNKTENFLAELEAAHTKVEQLTIHNERQRMARDLHDTLAQGLSAFKMQAEAINAHLAKGNYERAREITRLAMEQATTVLADSRLVIDNLRMYTDNTDLEHHIESQIKQFTMATGIPVNFDYTISEPVYPKLVEHCSRIVSECLLNIARYAKASEVHVILKKESNKTMSLEIIDDGVGFKLESALRKPGHYGLVGIKERTRILGGKVSILSKELKGTKIRIIIPLKGDY